MTPILDHMASYSGKMIEWSDAIASERSLLPERLTWDSKPLELPDEQGTYPSAIPGVTKVM